MAVPDASVTSLSGPFGTGGFRPLGGVRVTRTFSRAVPDWRLVVADVGDGRRTVPVVCDAWSFGATYVTALASTFESLVRLIVTMIRSWSAPVRAEPGTSALANATPVVSRRRHAEGLRCSPRRRNRGHGIVPAGFPVVVPIEL